MKKFTRDYRINEYDGDAWNRYFGGLRGCVFDIETTGLSPRGGRGKVILTAMLVYTGSGVRITQFLAEDPYEEDRVIAATMEYMEEEGIDYLITYNGASFDVPFVRDRIDYLHLPYEFNMYNFDMFTFVRNYTVLKKELDSLSQKNLERYFFIGSDRDDTITGRESARMYYEYITSHDSVLEKVILTHNREDVLQLYRILIEAGYDDFSRVLKDDVTFDMAIAKMGIPACDHGALTAKPKLTRGRLMVSGWQRKAPGLPLDARIFQTTERDISIEFRRATKSFEISMPLEKRGSSYYVNLRGLVQGAGADGSDKYRIRELDGYVNDYLILVDEGSTNQREINMLTRLLCDIALSEAKSV